MTASRSAAVILYNTGIARFLSSASQSLGPQLKHSPQFVVGGPLVVSHRRRGINGVLRLPLFTQSELPRVVFCVVGIFRAGHRPG
jgi:hypothetical protein